MRRRRLLDPVGDAAEIRLQALAGDGATRQRRPKLGGGGGCFGNAGCERHETAHLVLGQDGARCRDGHGTARHVGGGDPRQRAEARFDLGDPLVQSVGAGRQTGGGQFGAECRDFAAQLAV